MALKPTTARALSFEDRLDCWLLEECSPPAAWTVEDYFVHVINPVLLSDLLEIPMLPAPPGFPMAPGPMHVCSPECPDTHR